MRLIKLLIGIFLLLFLDSCFLNTSAAKSHSYKLISSSSVSSEPELWVFSTYGRKTYFIVFPNAELPDKVTIGSKLIKRKTNKDFSEMTRGSIYGKKALVKSLHVSDHVFYKAFPNDTVKIKVTKDRKEVTLVYVPLK